MNNAFEIYTIAFSSPPSRNEIHFRDFRKDVLLGLQQNFYTWRTGLPNWL